MDVLSAMRSSEQDEVREEFEMALTILQRAFKIWKVHEVALSFNAGKDSCAILHILRATLASMTPDNGARTEFSSYGVKCFMFVQSDDFEEILEFSKETNDKSSSSPDLYSEDSSIRTGSAVLGLAYVVQSGILCRRKRHQSRHTRYPKARDHDIYFSELSRDRGDPNAAGQERFCPTTEDWPPLMRINPILDWSYNHTWAFLRRIKVPYCKLYDQGFTSLGASSNTSPNIALRREDGTYAPAHSLADGRLERIGRAKVIHFSRHPHMLCQLGRRPSNHDSTDFAFTKKAALVIIGDELLSGKVSPSSLLCATPGSQVEDVNVVFLCRELRSIGWRVNKIVFTGDDVASIAEEVRGLSETHEMVITAGGVGPTVDDVTMRGIAAAMQTTLFRHPYLEKLIREFFRENVTEAHLKMTEVPMDEVEFLESSDERGMDPFPLVKCRNVYILPGGGLKGVPIYLKKSWSTLKRRLNEEGQLPPFHNVVLRLKSFDEAAIAPALDAVVQEIGPEIEIGSYPIADQADQANVLVCIESKIQSQMTVEIGEVVSEETQVRKWTRSRQSMQDILALYGSRQVDE